MTVTTSETMIDGIPAMGFGTWNLHGDDAAQCVTWALEAGYRHIDTAQGYQNEEFCGAAIADFGLPRADVFITTKVAPTNFGPGQLRPSVETSLEKLKVDQVDLLLVHWPSPHDEVPMALTLEQLAEVQDAGMARMIGVSNYTIAHMNEAVGLLGEGRIATNQVEVHVYCQNRPIVDHCRSLGVSITAYSPLARGAFLNDPVLTEVASAHGAGTMDVAIAFLLAEGHIVIPSSSKQDRIMTNLKAGKLDLTAAEVTRLRELDRDYRINDDADWMPVWDR